MIYAFLLAGKIAKIHAWYDASPSTSSTLPDLAAVFGNTDLPGAPTARSNSASSFSEDGSDLHITNFERNGALAISDGSSDVATCNSARQAVISSPGSSTVSVNGSPRPRVTPSVRHFRVVESDNSDAEKEFKQTAASPKPKKGWRTKNALTHKTDTPASGSKTQTDNVPKVLDAGAIRKAKDTPHGRSAEAGPGKKRLKKQKEKVAKEAPALAPQDESKRRKTAGKPPVRFITEN